MFLQCFRYKFSLWWAGVPELAFLRRVIHVMSRVFSLRNLMNNGSQRVWYFVIWLQVFQCLCKSVLAHHAIFWLLCRSITFYNFVILMNLTSIHLNSTASASKSKLTSISFNFPTGKSMGKNVKNYRRNCAWKKPFSSGTGYVLYD